MWDPGCHLAEFLNTAVGGPENLEREATELFGWADSDRLTKLAAEKGLLLSEHSVWTSPLYQKVWDEAGVTMPVAPLTHGRWVFTKL